MNKNEGPRSFARFLEHIADGQAQLELSAELHKLLLRLREEANARNSEVGGTLDLKLSIKVAPNGIAAIAYGIKRKEPDPKRPGSVMWLTEGGNLSATNPKQPSLPLMAVGDADEPTDVEEPKKRRINDV